MIDQEPTLSRFGRVDLKASRDKELVSKWILLRLDLERDYAILSKAESTPVSIMEKIDFERNLLDVLDLPKNLLNLVSIFILVYSITRWEYKLF